jgi:two-component system cell cycle sensor histidine kinase/response regulator CckA
MPPHPLRVLVVDDALEHAELVRDMVRFSEGWPDAAIDVAGSYEEALRAMEATTYDLAFIDYWLDTRDGLTLIREIQQRGIPSPVIMITGHGAEETAVEAMKAGAADYLSKSNLSVESVAHAMRHALALGAQERQRRELEEQLRESQKMEAVGQLAGGVAHDFNNLLTAILGYCSLLLDEAPPGHAMHDDLEEIRNAGERAAALVRQLLAFSRRQMLRPEPVDLNALVERMDDALRRSLGPSIELVTTLGEGLPVIHVDPRSIEQVLTSLALNARDAMPGGGRLTVQTTVVDLSESDGDPLSTLAPGRYVVLTVSDTGQGMDAETRARAFEPFFTTKGLGHGTGLGLASVYGIVKQNDGDIRVHSEPQRGAAFQVYFPAIDSPAQQPSGINHAAASKRRWSRSV